MCINKQHILFTVGHRTRVQYTESVAHPTDEKTPNGHEIRSTKCHSRARVYTSKMHVATSQSSE